MKRSILKKGLIAGMILSLSFVVSIHAKETTKMPDTVQMQSAYGKLPLYFIENNGQLDKKVVFYEKGQGRTTLFTKEGVSFVLNGRPPVAPTNTPSPITLSFVGANKSPKITAEGLQPGKVNYFIGNDPKQWKTDIPTYGAVRYEQIYKGIDAKFYGNNRQMEYDFIVAPGGIPTRLVFV